MSYGIVYLIRNEVNGKCYVGQTVRDPHVRFRDHASECNARLGHPISRAMRKYGQENFTISTLQECSDQSELDAAERHWATELATFVPNGYNLAAGRGRGSVSEPVRRKIGKAMMGKQHLLGYRFSAESRLKMSRAHLGKKRGPHTEETKRKISAAHVGKPSPLRGVPKSPETRWKLSMAKRGKPATPAQRAATKEAMNRPEVRAKLVVAREHQKPTFLGHHHTEEAKRAIGDKNRAYPHRAGWHHTEEAKRRISETKRIRRLRRTVAELAARLERTGLFPQMNRPENWDNPNGGN